MLAATEELEKARRLEELARAKELAAIMANMGQNTSSKRNLAEPRGTKEKDPAKETKLVARATSVNEREWEKEYEALKDELITQARIKENENLEDPKNDKEEK